MNIKLAFFTSLLLAFSSVHGQTPDQQIAKLLNESDWFGLYETYPRIKDSIQSPVLKGMSEVMLNMHFNHLQGTLDAIADLLQNHQEKLGSNLVPLFVYLSQTLGRAGGYAQSADQMDELTKALSRQMEPEKFPDLIDIRDYYQRLRNEKAPLLFRKLETLEIPVTIENITRGQSIFVPVTIHGRQYRFLFDTGSSNTGISQRLADELGIQALSDSVTIRGNFAAISGKLTILDSLQIGNLTFRNGLTFIYPVNETLDSIVQLDGIIGIDFMNLAGEFHIYPQEGKIVFPWPLPQPSGNKPNMMLTNDRLFLSVSSGSEKLVMLFDSGNVTADLSFRYYSKHQEWLEKNCARNTIPVRGIGGSSTQEVLQLASLPLRLGETSFELPDINVSITPETIFNDQEDGTLGMLFIRQFRKIIVNFKEMYVKAEK